MKVPGGASEACCIHPRAITAEDLKVEGAGLIPLVSVSRVVVGLNYHWYLHQPYGLASGWVGRCGLCGTIFWTQVQGEPADFCRHIGRYLDNQKDRPTWADSKRLTAHALESYTRRCAEHKKGKPWYPR